MSGNLLDPVETHNNDNNGPSYSIKCSDSLPSLPSTFYYQTFLWRLSSLILQTLSPPRRSNGPASPGGVYGSLRQCRRALAGHSNDFDERLQVSLISCSVVFQELLLENLKHLSISHLSLILRTGMDRLRGSHIQAFFTCSRRAFHAT